MKIANHHAHSDFSDGRLKPRDYLNQALSQGLQTYGFSDHAPIPSSSVSLMTIAELEKYLLEIESLKEEFSGKIQVYKGLEVDYIPNVISLNSEHIQAANLDYSIGAVHYVDHFVDGTPWGFEGTVENFEKGLKEIFEGDVRAAIERYFSLIREMLSISQPDIVAHIDRIKKLNRNGRFFSEKADWYQVALLQTLEVIAEKEVILEVNTKGFYRNETVEPYPGSWILNRAFEMNIPVHLASDAHHPDDITKGFDYGATLLQEVGYGSCQILVDGTWQAVSFKQQNIYTL